MTALKAPPPAPVTYKTVVETAELSEDKEFVTSLKAAKAEVERGESFTFEGVFGEKI